MSKKQPDYWRLCRECGEKMYPPETRKRSAGAITVSMGQCPLCKKKDVTLIPVRDLEFETHPNPNPEMWD